MRVTIESLTEQLELADQLLEGRDSVRVLRVGVRVVAAPHHPIDAERVIAVKLAIEARLDRPIVIEATTAVVR